MPARFETERTRLLLQVGELPAGHLVQIDFGCPGLEIALEGDILRPHHLPIEADPADRLRIKARVTLGKLERLDDRAQRGL